MPGININALKVAEQIAIDVCSLKVGEELEMNFKDGPIVIKRVR